MSIEALLVNSALKAVHEALESVQPIRRTDCSEYPKCLREAMDPYCRDCEGWPRVTESGQDCESMQECAEQYSVDVCTFCEEV